MTSRAESGLQAVACKERIRAAVPTSWEKLLDILDYMNTVVDSGVLIEFAIKAIAPGKPSRNAENVAVALSLGVSKNTVENWRCQVTKCSMPMRMGVAVGRVFDDPEGVVAALSEFTGEDHAQFFDWMGVSE